MQKQFKYDDTYLYDLEIPLRPRPEIEPEDFAYDYETPADLGFNIIQVLERSYFNCKIAINSDEYWNFYTDCAPSVFKMIYERALMEKYYKDTGVFCFTQNELNENLDWAIRHISGRNGWCVYNPAWEREEKRWQPIVFTNIDAEENAGQKRIKLNDAYTFDLDVPVYLGSALEPKSEPEAYAYDYEVSSEISVAIIEVLQRTYHSHIGAYDDDENIVHFYTDCEPDSFKMVYERALMEKFYGETGKYCLTKNEVESMLEWIIPVAAEKQNWETFDRQKLLETAQKLLQFYKLTGGKQAT